MFANIAVFVGYITLGIVASMALVTLLYIVWLKLSRSLFFDSMVSNESTTSYTVKLNKDIANMKRYTLVDYLIRKGGVKKPDKDLEEVG